jgi:UDP-2-acetamido-2-deoxy-ribo-hexuluronate aminotransferase
VLIEKLRVFSEEIPMRQRVADRYAAGFGDLVKWPRVPENAQSTWARYTIEVADRDGCRAHLAAKGVPSAIYYPIPLHLHEPYTPYPVAPGGLPWTEAAAYRVVSLPMHSDIYDADINQVIDAVLSYPAAHV